MAQAGTPTSASTIGPLSPGPAPDGAQPAPPPLSQPGCHVHSIPSPNGSFRPVRIPAPPAPPPPTGIEIELKAILKEVRVVTDKIRAEADASIIENEWKFAAMVLDRVCLIAFTMFTVLLSAAILLAAPHVVVT